MNPKLIVRDFWLSAFPELRAYSPNKLYKIVGPFVCGIELIAMRWVDNYRPHFMLYPLYGGDAKSCLKWPILLTEFYSEKRIQFDIPYSDLIEDHAKAWNAVLRSLPISLTGAVSIDQLQHLVQFVSIDRSYYIRNSGLRAKILNALYYSALYVGDMNKVDEIIDNIKKESETWDIESFQRGHGDLDIWLQNLEKSKADRERIMETIETNIQGKKLSKLVFSELVNTTQ